MSTKILIVEDHADSAYLTARLLRMTGYEVQTASGYGQALKAASQSTFDLMICDIGLPDGNGCALLRELHRQYGLDGIAVTGYGLPWDVSEVKRAGFLDHLVKPLDFEKLKAAVAVAMENKSAAIRQGSQESGSANNGLDREGLAGE